MSVDLLNLPMESGDTPQVSWDNYQDPSEFAPPIPEGTYNFKTTKLEIEKFENGVVSFIADHEAFDPATGNKVGSINFDRFSTKVFERQGVPASMAADMLRAAGITERPTSPRQWGEQILSIKAMCDQGQTWAGAVGWDGYCDHKDTPKAALKDANNKVLPAAQQTPPHAAPVSLKGMKQWKVSGTNTNGAEPTYNATVACAVCGNDIQARAKIARRIPK